MKLKSILFPILLFVVFSPLSYGQQQEPLPVRLNPISEHLYEILGGSGANGGLYIGDDGVLVIDAKMDSSSVNETLQAIHKITEKSIKYLVNTHSDGDHISGNRYFPKSVIFVAHENCRKELFHPDRNGSESQWLNSELTPFIPSITFREKMDIYLGTKKVELWYFGVGHTTGDIVVYFPEEKTAFIGDQIFLGRPQLIHAYKGGKSFEHVNTLEKMLDTLEAEQFCSGHSEIVDRETIQNHIDQMKKLQEKVRLFIAENKSVEEIQSEFEENQAGLIGTIITEIQSNDE